MYGIFYFRAWASLANLSNDSDRSFDKKKVSQEVCTDNIINCLNTSPQKNLSLYFECFGFQSQGLFSYISINL